MEEKYKVEDDINNIAKSVSRRPTQSRKKKKNNSIILAALLILVIGIIIGVVVTVLVSKKDDIDDSKNPSDVEMEEQSEQSNGTVENMLKEDGIVIDTPFVELYYPEKWENMLDVEQVEGDTYTIKFFATVEGKEDIHIFDIVFNGEEGFALGYLKSEDDVQTSIRVISYEIDFSGDWTDDEKSMVYTMAEDVNYTIGMIEKAEGFVPAS